MLRFLLSLLPREWLTPRILVPGAVLSYLVLVRALRYRKRNALIRTYERKHGAYARETLSQMNVDEAWSVIKALMELEFPTIFNTSLTFALFKTYGIPTISRLLVATGELASNKTVSKRAADTGVLVSEFVLNNPDSARKFEGIARMNYLHNPHRKAGRISDDDMLYTLSLFALEPVRWVNRYEWRPMTELERAAMGVYWRDMGEAMGIPFEQLEPYMGERRDGLTWLEAMDKWSVKYEETFMVPADTNETLAQETLGLLVHDTPAVLKGFKLRLIASLLEERLRVAMKIREPGKFYRRIMSALMKLHLWTVRYVHLPRFYPSPVFSDEPDPKTGKYHCAEYLVHPWYVKPTFWGRWGPDAWWTRLWGGYLPGDEGMRFHPDGYHIGEVGPESQFGKGKTEMEKIKEQLRERRAGQGGCPMAVFRKA